MLNTHDMCVGHGILHDKGSVKEGEVYAEGSVTKGNVHS